MTSYVAFHFTNTIVCISEQEEIKDDPCSRLVMSCEAERLFPFSFLSCLVSKHKLLLLPFGIYLLMQFRAAKLFSLSVKFSSTKPHVQWPDGKAGSLTLWDLSL